MAETKTKKRTSKKIQKTTNGVVILDFTGAYNNEEPQVSTENSNICEDVYYDQGIGEMSHGVEIIPTPQVKVSLWTIIKNWFKKIFSHKCTCCNKCCKCCCDCCDKCLCCENR